MLFAPGKVAVTSRGVRRPARRRRLAAPSPTPAPSPASAPSPAPAVMMRRAGSTHELRGCLGGGRSDALWPRGIRCLAAHRSGPAHAHPARGRVGGAARAAYTCHVHMKTRVDLRLVDEHCVRLLHVSSHLSSLAQRERYGRFRAPLRERAPPLPRTWWHYAYNCVARRHDAPPSGAAGPTSWRTAAAGVSICHSGVSAFSPWLGPSVDPQRRQLPRPPRP